MTRLTSGCAIAALTIQFFGWTTLSAGAQVLMLVTDAEVAADRAAAVPPPAGTRGLQLSPAPKESPNPNAPHIDVLAPEIIGRPLVVPFPIKVRFIAAAGHEIDPATLRVFYGQLGLDITSRILATTPVTRQGLDVPGARIPKGSHRLLLEIRDDAANVGRRELAFEVRE